MTDNPQTQNAPLRKGAPAVGERTRGPGQFYQPQDYPSAEAPVGVLTGRFVLAWKAVARWPLAKGRLKKCWPLEMSLWVQDRHPAIHPINAQKLQSDDGITQRISPPAKKQKSVKKHNFHIC